MAGFTGERPPRRFNMAEYVIGRAARTTPDKVALIVIGDVAAAAPSETWTYRDLDRAVLRVAAALRSRGFVAGDRLLIRLENTSAYAVLFFGAIAAGLVPIPASSQLTDRETAFVLTNSGALGVVLPDHVEVLGAPDKIITLHARDIAAMIANPAEIAAVYAATSDDDPAYMIYTSGTTSHPKGVLHAQRAAWGRRPMYRGWYDLSDADRMLHAGAFNWTYTLGVGLTDPWANGATAIVYTGDKHPAAWPKLIEATGATLFAAVPSLFRQILKYAPPQRGMLATLRHGLIAGEAPPQALFDDWHQATGTHLFEAFGMSEISTYVSSSPTTPRKSGSIGRAQPGRALAILPVDGGTIPLSAGEEGLIAVHRSDPGLMLGYWLRPEEDAEVSRGEWFIGGDLGVMDADGYIAHRGRANDIMKALGYRVAPQEIEDVLAQTPGVAEIACAEVQVRGDVCVIGAFVVPVAGMVLDKEGMLALARQALASYKVPREIIVVERLPRTANGKLKRKELAALFEAMKKDKSP